MSTKTDRAIAKITDEAMKINNPIAIALEEHLTQKCTSDTVADLLLAEDKQLRKIIGDIRAEARKQAQDGCAEIPDEEVYAMVDRYYGLDRIGNMAHREERSDRVNVLDLF